MQPLWGRKALLEPLGLGWSPCWADMGLGFAKAPSKPDREKFCFSPLFQKPGTCSVFRPGKGWEGSSGMSPSRARPLGEVFKYM